MLSVNDCDELMSVCVSVSDLRWIYFVRWSFPDSDRWCLVVWYDWESGALPGWISRLSVPVLQCLVSSPCPSTHLYTCYRAIQLLLHCVLTRREATRPQTAHPVSSTLTSILYIVFIKVANSRFKTNKSFWI